MAETNEGDTGQPERRTSISFTPRSSSPDPESPQSLNQPLLLRVEDSDEDGLILLPEPDDSDAGSDGYEYYTPHEQRPLTPGRVLFLILSPTLRLGAFALPFIPSRPAISIPSLFLASLLALFVRHLWVMLAHYVRKITVEDILCELSFKFGVSRRWRGFIKTLARTVGTLFRLLLLLSYVRLTVHLTTTLFPNTKSPSPFIALGIFIVTAVTIPLSSSLASPYVFYCTLLSSVFYVIWAFLTFRNRLLRNSQVSEPVLSILHLTSLWDPLTCGLMAFASFPPLSIYAGLAMHRHPVQDSNDRPRRKRTSFGTLSATACCLTLILTVPLLSVPPKGTFVARGAFEVAQALAIFFSFPEVIASLPHLPWPTARSRFALHPKLCSQVLPRILAFGLSILCSFLPPFLISVFTTILLIATLFGVYIFPALLHILFHNLFRPVAIVVPNGGSPPLTAATLRANTAERGVTEEEGLRSLLFSKETRMQRRRLLRRLVWDLGAWLLILTASAWIVGRSAGWRI